MTDKSYSNSGRRKFFKSFVGQAIAFFEEITGHRNIPLNKLDTLPDDIIKGIIPVMFNDEGWNFKDNFLMKYSDTEKKYQVFRELKEEELFFIKYFNNKKSLDHIARLYSKKYEKDFQISFKKVTDFFFEMARLRVYHPLKVYDYD